MIEVPLLRIQESDSSDLESVAQCVISHLPHSPAFFDRRFLCVIKRPFNHRYYSSHIVAFIRLCLEVVPVTMFRILTDQVFFRRGLGFIICKCC